MFCDSIIGVATQTETEGQYDMIEAHYTTGKQPTLCFAATTNGQRAWIEERIPVSGKREAQKLAAERGATPWNF